MSTGSRLFNATSDLTDSGTWGFTTDGTNGSGFTLACWVKFNSLSSGRSDRFISKASGTSEPAHDWMLGNTYTTAQVLRARGPGDGLICRTVVGTTTLTTGVWYHAAYRVIVVAGVVNNYLYLNGVEDGSAGAYGPLFITSSTNQIYVGNQPTSTTSAPNGYLSDVAVWSVPLTTTQIADLAAKTTRPSDYPTGLEVYYSGGDLTDSSGNARTATNSGTDLDADDPGFGAAQSTHRNGIALSAISAINGITKTGISAVNGLTI